MTDLDDLAMIVPGSAHRGDGIITALDVHPCNDNILVTSAFPCDLLSSPRPLTIVITVDKCDGDIELVHPVGNGPPRMSTGRQQVGDGILGTALRTRQSVEAYHNLSEPPFVTDARVLDPRSYSRPNVIMQIGDILFWQRRKPPRRILGDQHRPYGTQLAYQAERADPSFPHIVDGLFPPSMVPPLGLLVGLKVVGIDRLRRLLPPDAWTGGD